MSQTDKKLPEMLNTVISLLRNHPGLGNLDLEKSKVNLDALDGDGSNRQFFRFQAGAFFCIVAMPGTLEHKNLLEAGAAFAIGSHLHAVGAPVPKLFGYDEKSGLVLYEDLGSTHLQQIVAASDFGDPADVERISDLYCQALGALAEMQVRGREGFRQEWCWDTPRYDRQLMLERESGYFLRCCWHNLLGNGEVAGLTDDFIRLADLAGSADNGYFLHRDFQSRNIMVCDGQVRFIDYQGGRLGPLGYDVASLLIDPYTALPEWFQERMLDGYLALLGREKPMAAQGVRKTYDALALQRNLQFTGAFCYLGLECNKSFFKQFIRPALATMNRLLQKGDLRSLSVLTEVAETALDQIPDHL